MIKIILGIADVKEKLEKMRQESVIMENVLKSMRAEFNKKKKENLIKNGYEILNLSWASRLKLLESFRNLSVQKPSYACVQKMHELLVNKGKLVGLLFYYFYIAATFSWRLFNHIKNDKESILLSLSNTYIYLNHTKITETI